MEKLNDAGEPYGQVLDKALATLSEHNESLEHVLDHIMFVRTQGNKRIVSDEACRELVRHFNKHRFRNEDFQFTNRVTSGLTRIERARGFLDAARLSEDWLEEMRSCALLLEAHHSPWDFEGLCPDTNRRSLQRDLKFLLDEGLVLASGATNRLEYRLS